MNTIIRVGKPEDFLYIDTLRKKEGNALGFIPKDVYLSVLENRRIANRDRHHYQCISITEDNGQNTGYCMYSFAGQVTDIFQIVIQNDARRWHRALMMVNKVEEESIKLQKAGIKCRVAIDLESNLFWEGIGFKPIKVVTSTWLNQKESKSKRPLIIYFKPLQTLF